MLVPLKALKNKFFMFRLQSVITLMNVLCRKLALLELPSGKTQESLAESVCYGIDIHYKYIKF